MAQLPPSRRILSMVLAGGEGKRLMPLTRDRAKPAVPFGGKYRLIDFALSNLVNGGYRRIVVLTQYKSHSLNVHLSRTWRMSTLLGNYVTSVPAQMRMGKRWFVGSGDALFQNINIIEDEAPEHIFVFGADHIYRMDPNQMLQAHVDSGAGVTVAGIRVPIAEATAFGVIQQSKDSTRIEKFWEKPAEPPSTPDDPTMAFASMGNYVYDFTQNEVPGVTDREHGYWRDVGTLDSYFDANMDLVSVDPVFNLYNRDWPIYTSEITAPPAKVVAVADYGAGGMSDSILGNGVVVSGGFVAHSVLAPWVRVEPGATVDHCVLSEDVVIESGAQVRNAIIDKNVVVPPGFRIGFDAEEDRARGFEVTESGIVAVAKNHRFDI